MKKTILGGYAFVILSAVIFGCMPLMADYIYKDGVNALSLVLLRNLISLPPLALLGYLGGRSLKIEVRALPFTALVGIFGCALTPFLLFSSYNYMDSGTATVLHFVYPAAVLVIELVFVRARAELGKVIPILLCVFGIAFFYTPGAALDLGGSLIALSSGLAYAVYIVLLGVFSSRFSVNGFLFGFYTTLFATVALFFVTLLSGSLTLPSSLGGLLLTAFFAVAINVGAVILFQCGAFILGGARASILSTLEPITSLFLGVLFLDEGISLFTVFGALLVISASVAVSLFDLRREGGR